MGYGAESFAAVNNPIVDLDRLANTLGYTPAETILESRNILHKHFDDFLELDDDDIWQVVWEFDNRHKKIRWSSDPQNICQYIFSKDQTLKKIFDRKDAEYDRIERITKLRQTAGILWLFWRCCGVR